MTTLTIKNFTVLDTDTGQMPITGRLTTKQLNNILSHSIIINGLTEQVAVPGMPTEIASGDLVGNAHLCSTYIKIINEYQVALSNDSVFINDGFVRITYLGGTTAASVSLIYGFASSTTTPINNIVWNVAFAKNITQTGGDYIDVSFPDMTYYPNGNFYIAFILINSAWDNRTIVNGNICSITNVNHDNYCIDSSKSLYDTDKAHFINSQGINANFGIYSRISIASEDWTSVITDNDYNDLLFSVSSRFVSDLNINDTSIN